MKRLLLALFALVLLLGALTLPALADTETDLPVWTYRMVSGSGAALGTFSGEGKLKLTLSAGDGWGVLATCSDGTTELWGVKGGKEIAVSGHGSKGTVNLKKVPLLYQPADPDATPPVEEINNCACFSFESGDAQTFELTIDTEKRKITWRFTGYTDPERVLTADMVTVTEGLVYSGEEQAAEITVRFGSTVLEEGVDYTVDGQRSGTDAGMYRLTVRGMGRYSGEAELMWSIARAPSTIRAWPGDYCYHASLGGVVQVHVQGTGRVSYSSRRPGIAKVDNTGLITARNIGATLIDVTTSGDRNHEGATCCFWFHVYAADLGESATGTLDCNTFVYDGTAHEPAVTLRDGGLTLVEGADYTVSYENNTEPGTAAAVITGLDDYAGSSLLLYFRIVEDASGAELTIPAGEEPQAVLSRMEAVLSQSGVSLLTDEEGTTLAAVRLDTAGPAKSLTHEETVALFGTFLAEEGSGISLISDGESVLLSTGHPEGVNGALTVSGGSCALLLPADGDTTVVQAELTGEDLQALLASGRAVTNEYGDTDTAVWLLSGLDEADIQPEEVYPVTLLSCDLPEGVSSTGEEEAPVYFAEAFAAWFAARSW